MDRVTARKPTPASAPASRTSFRRGPSAQRITVSTLRNSVIAEADDSEDDEGDGQYATMRDDESIPVIEIQSASSYKGSPATARVPSFSWETQINRSIDQQLRSAALIANRGELVKLAAARRMHQRRSQSMYLSSETPATPPLSPPNAGFSSLASPAPFTSAISPYPFVPGFHIPGMPVGMPMMPMTAIGGASMQQQARVLQQQQQGPPRAHRRATSASHGTPGEAASAAAALPSLDEIRVLFEKRKAAAAKKDEVQAAEDKLTGAAAPKEEGEDKPKEDDRPKEETDREKRASGLKLLKRRSLALQTDGDALASPVQAQSKTPSPVSPAKPQLSPLNTQTPAITVSPVEAKSPKVASPARRRPISLQLPAASAFQGLPTVLRSPEPPKNLLAMRNQQSGEGRALAARKMMNRLSLSNRVVTVA